MITTQRCGLRGSVASYQLDDPWEDVEIPLTGAHQVTNTLTVLGVVEELRRQGWKLPEKAVRQGIASTQWPARLEWVGEHLLLDGAHNPQGVKALAAYVQANLQDKKLCLLTGVLADKLQPDMLQTLAHLAPNIVTVTPDTPRAMAAEEYAQRLQTAGGNATAAASLAEGLTMAQSLAGEDGVVVAAGSLYFAGALRELLGLPWRSA